MTTLTRSELKVIIQNAVNQLQFAEDKHNCGSERVKIYLNEDGELYYTVQDANSTNQGHNELIRFEYSRPDYNTNQEILDENQNTGTIAEWDWEMFTCGEDYDNYCEQLLDLLIESFDTLD